HASRRSWTTRALPATYPHRPAAFPLDLFPKLREGRDVPKDPPHARDGVSPRGALHAGLAVNEAEPVPARDEEDVPGVVEPDDVLLLLRLGNLDPQAEHVSAPDRVRHLSLERQPLPDPVAEVGGQVVMQLALEGMPVELDHNR